MKTINTALLAAALSATVMSNASASSPEGQIHRPRDSFTDGARAAVNNLYGAGTRVEPRDVFTDGARVHEKRDVFSDGARIEQRDVFTDGARGI